MKKDRLLHIMVILIALIPMIYLALTWSSIPEIVPVHFNIEMEPDRYGNKNELIWVTGLLSVVSYLVFLLLCNLHRFDPKRKKLPPSTRFTRLGTGLVIFLSAISILIILSASHGGRLMESLFFPLIGLMFAFLGNYMVNLKPNYFAGFRLPWTLNDNENWRKTHQLGGKIWFWAGLGFAVMSLFIPFKWVLVVFVGMMVIITVWPVVFSYKLYKRKQDFKVEN
jgi:uncharacterized membrane protein